MLRAVLLQKVFLQYDQQRTSTLDSFELRSALNSAGESDVLRFSLDLYSVLLALLQRLDAYTFLSTFIIVLGRTACAIY